jgi:ribosomal-protein-alanine N-acetyltransferase
MRTISDAFPFPYTRTAGEEFISRVSKDNPTKIFAVDREGKAVGSIGIFPQTDIHSKNAELGYFLGERYWGLGIMSDAVRQIAEYGFRTFDITRVYACPFGNNKASHRVLEKAGFILEARFIDAVFKNGEFLDELIYSKRIAAAAQ